MADKNSSQDATVHRFPFRSPRFWHGMVASVWFGLLWRGGFAVSLLRSPLCISITLFTFLNAAAAALQSLLFGRRIRRTKIDQPPIFIIGHWRSGTTHLHELMVLDPHFDCPTTYECLAPSHCLTTGWLITRLKFLLPAERPMDNMLLGWDRPQEDEFALANLGVGSPYETIAFPNRRPLRHEFLTLQSVSPAERSRWTEALDWFLRLVTFCRSRKLPAGSSPPRIVLKSPPHTARVALLRELYPDARFVHMVRNPYTLFSSSVRLWKSLWEAQALQTPRFERSGSRPSVEEYVFETFRDMYRDFDEQKATVPDEQFCEVRYEDLVRDPLGEMRRIYEHLQLGDFEQARPRLETYLADVKDYQPNRHSIPPETREAITQNWGDFIRKYGYAEAPAVAPV